MKSKEYQKFDQTMNTILEADPESGESCDGSGEES